MSEHMPTPWSYISCLIGGNDGFKVQDANEAAVCDIPWSAPFGETAARTIVCHANSHDAMRAALRDLIATCESLDDVIQGRVQGGEQRRAETAIASARAALALAEKGTEG